MTRVFQGALRRVRETTTFGVSRRRGAKWRVLVDVVALVGRRPAGRHHHAFSTGPQAAMRETRRTTNQTSAQPASTSRTDETTLAFRSTTPQFAPSR